MTDLISREEALTAVTDIAVDRGVTGEPAILLATKNAIRALPAAQVKVKPLVWEPVDTAPKDGTRVILWRGPAEFGKQSEMVIAEWHGGEWQWPDEAENPCTHGEWSEEDRQGGYYSDGRYFTHWMPLPTAPVDASQMPDPILRPTMTDLMVDPDTFDGFMEANPLPPDPVVTDPRVKALVELLREANGDLKAYVDADWPEDLRAQYPSDQRKWERDMELCNRIDAALRAIGGEA